MPADRTASPIIIIKRVQGEGEGGHHGGAWKVAYADFVTAMMAFFLLMWLLNATTEKQRQGLADYFDPTISHARSGGAQGIDGGRSLDPPADRSVPGPAGEAEMQQLARALQDALTARGGESMQRVNLLRHVVTRMTDEGLVIELGDVVDEPLFQGETAEPTPVLRELTAILASVLGRARNQLAITGHVRAFPRMMIDNPVWPLSDQRAHAVRELVVQGRLEEDRIQRVTAFGDKKPRNSNPMDPANNRIEVILLR